MAALMQATPCARIAALTSVRSGEASQARSLSAPPSLLFKTNNKESLSCFSGDLSIFADRSRSFHRQRPMQARAMAADQAGSGVAVKPVHVLFVCLGNICRSPSAEAVFRAVVEKRGLADSFVIDSAGMIDYHQGQPADRRMKDHAARRGVNLTSISRPVVRSDFETFDVILAMDNENLGDLRKAHGGWNAQSPLPPNALDKVKLMCSYCRTFKEKEVPDPYYGGPAGFEKIQMSKSRARNGSGYVGRRVRGLTRFSFGAKSVTPVAECRIPSA